MIRRTTLALAMLLLCGLASAQLALFTLDELVKDSKSIFVADVDWVSDPSWRDENGSRILLADAVVVRRLRAAPEHRVTIAFKEGVADQPQFKAGHRFVIFTFGRVAAILMAHQLLALPVDGSLVDTSALRHEPEKPNT